MSGKGPSKYAAVNEIINRFGWRVGTETPVNGETIRNIDTYARTETIDGHCIDTESRARGNSPGAKGKSMGRAGRGDDIPAGDCAPDGGPWGKFVG